MTGTCAEVYCSVSVGLVLGQWWIVSYQQAWNWDRRGLCFISRTGTGTVVECLV